MTECYEKNRRVAARAVSWARPVYATEPAEAWEPGDVIDVEFHNHPEKPEGEGWRPLVFADTDDTARVVEALRAEVDQLSEALRRWWEAHRPVGWTEDQHRSCPHVNLATNAEKALADAMLKVRGGGGAQ